MWPIASLGVDCSFLYLQVQQSCWQQAPTVERVAGKEGKVRPRRKQTVKGGGWLGRVVSVCFISMPPKTHLGNISYHCSHNCTKILYTHTHSLSAFSKSSQIILLFKNLCQFPLPWGCTLQREVHLPRLWRKMILNAINNFYFTSYIILI